MSRNHACLDWARWQQTRKAAFGRDGYRCSRCDKAGKLEAHHDPPLGPGVDPYDVEGIKTLCRSCHIDIHKPTLTPVEEAWKAMVQEIKNE